MPRENRKRGKKNKKTADDVADPPAPQQGETPAEHASEYAGPSWIAASRENTAMDHEAPFGYVDAEVKAYFRTIDVQIRKWQEELDTPESTDDSDPNEDRHLFFVAALSEMSGKEKQLATDPDCSIILERMVYSMDDFVRRVFVDSLSGSYEQMFSHRFASHVCQTLLTVAGDSVGRECRGIYPSPPESTATGELRTLSQLILDLCEEILPAFLALVSDPFASHVIRALLTLLVPGLSSHMQINSHGSSIIRSKKSAAYKAKQGPLKSVFASSNAEDSATGLKPVPEGFKASAKKFVTYLREKLDDNEIRALAASPVASPVVQLLLEVEAEHNMAGEPGSLMDCVLAGLITTLHDDGLATPEPSDYVGTLLRDPTSSHLLETLVSHSPAHVLSVLWNTYFKGKLSRLAVHPVANFVVAKALLRVSEEQLREICQELEGTLGKILKSSRIGVFRAIVDRASDLKLQDSVVMETVCSAFHLQSAEDRRHMVSCVLRLLPLDEYKDAQNKERPDPSRQDRENVDPSSSLLEPKTQGALLLQSLLSLPTPHNQLVINSVLALGTDESLDMSRHVTSSRVFDAILESSTVPSKAKRQFVLKFLGHFPSLVDDRIGSRVGDRCWAYADPYLKEKIARSVMAYEQFLAGSFYGKFFVRHLNLQLLRRSPEQWKRLQIASKTASKPTEAVPKARVVSGPTASKLAEVIPHQSAKRKRKERIEDEIDQLFDVTLGKKTKRAGLGSDAVVEKSQLAATSKKITQTETQDRALNDIIGAIKAAPKSEARNRKKRIK